MEVSRAFEEVEAVEANDARNCMDDRTRRR